MANKIVNGNQMMVTWHVDDLKVSHVEEMELTKFVLSMARVYGNKITVTGGHCHDYLGMDLDYSMTGKVRISMIKYIEKVFQEFPEFIETTSATPAADH